MQLLKRSSPVFFAQPGVGYERGRCLYMMILCLIMCHQPHALASSIPCGWNSFDHFSDQVAISTWRPTLGAAERFGEAYHPGPVDSCNEIRFCVTNPTCIAKKSDTYKDLMKAYDIKVFSMSETAATEVVQKHFAHDMKKQKCRMLWSPPVQPHCQTSQGQAHQRGKASGVAAASAVPIRPIRNKLPDEWATTTRFVHGVLQLGQSHCQLLVLYCKPVSQTNAVEYNNQLLQLAIQQASLLPLPYMILGDFNMPVESFESWPLLESKGFRSLDQLHLRLYSTPMPNTCKGVTKPDNAIVSPLLVPFVSRIQVLEETWLATHSPVMFQLSLPGPVLFAKHIRFPKSFVELDIADQHWDNMVDVSGALQNASSIQEWGEAVENNIDKYLRQGVGSVPFLSKAFRGRCQPVTFVKCPIMSPTKVANQGSFEPSCEVLSMPTRRKVTQVRRLESLWRRLNKLEKEGPKNENTMAELKGEWKAIVRSQCFGSPFLQWICSWSCFDFPSWPLPEASWVFEVLQFTKYHLEISLKEDAKIQKNKLEYLRFLDAANHNKAAYATVRGPGMPRVHEIGRVQTCEAIAVPSDDGHEHSLYMDSIETEKFSMDFPLAIGEVSAEVISIEEHRLQVRTKESFPEWPEQIMVSQHQFAISPADLAKHLDSFWKPIWNRDHVSMDFMQAESDTCPFHELLTHMPAHPQIQVDMLSREAWSKAVKKLKAQSARGTDKISAQELKLLPWCYLEKLAVIMSSYPQGFPASFMHGLICPLSKTDEIPEAKQTRPITLLPQLYRLWAAVMTAEITKVLCTWIPNDITGLLPRRGAANAAYFSQFHIEKARRYHKSISGLTLDIIKCFNCIRWDFGFHALLALGVPRQLLVVWMASIQALTRHWLLNNQVITAGQGSCGFPEGDQFSVITMIAVATVWTTSTRARLTNPEDTLLSAYADNWSWINSTVTEHLPTLRNTLAIMDAAGTSIDWQKTWFWSTCNRHANDIQNIVQQCVPGQQIQQKSSAADLGFQLQYSGNNTLGITTTRLQKGFQRLLRLQAMPHTLVIKETMLRTSVYPAALHGSEIKPLSIDNLQQLRTRAARALFGHNNSMSPALALSCTKGGVLDPEYWIIAKALCTARHFLLNQSQEVQHAFFYMCSRFQGTLQQVCGPASALAFMLSQLSLQLDANGFLHATAFLKFSVLGVSRKRLLRFLQDAWMERLVIMHTNRFKWFQFPDISLPETVQVLNGFADSKRWMLIREISGAYQVATQKQKWLSHATGLCPHCNMEDSRFHRLMECPLGSDVRQHYQPLLDVLIEEESLLPYYPVITVHPDAEAITLLQFQLPEAVWSENVLQKVREKQDNNETLHWFTDGSCMLPCQVGSSFSAFTVILDLCQSDDERCLVADQFRDSPVNVPSLQIACVARSQGEQDILRAETWAILAIAGNVGSGVVHSDSQTAINNARKALTAFSPSDFATCEHMDLLCRLWQIRHDVNLELVKVKAHQCIRTIPDPLLRYWAMGNDFADSTAQHACLYMMPDFVSTMQRKHAEVSKDQKNLEIVCCLHVELQEVRAKATIQNPEENQVVQHDHRAICEAYSNWTINRTPYVFPEADLQFVADCAFGNEIALETYEWMKKLTWPSTDDGPLGFNTGVTWIELGLSWMLHNQRYMPVLRKDNLGIMRLLYPADYVSAKDKGFTYVEAGTMMQRITDNLTSLIPGPVWPDDTLRQKVSAIYRLGAHRFHQGINKRPSFPFQSEVVDILQKSVSCGQTDGLSATPSVDCVRRQEEVAKGTWQFRVDKAKLAMKRVRAKRLLCS